MIKELIANGRIKKAIDAIRESLEPNDPKEKDILRLSAEFHSFSSDQSIGILDMEEFANQKRRIIKELIELIS